jgi:hypothetical protein
MAAEACPSILWTAFTLAPAATARLAAVLRSWCGVSPSKANARGGLVEAPAPEVVVAEDTTARRGKREIIQGPSRDPI